MDLCCQPEQRKRNVHPLVAHVLFILISAVSYFFCTEQAVADHPDWINVKCKAYLAGEKDGHYKHKFEGDIGIIVLDKPFGLKPIPIYKSYVNDGTQVTTIGWGTDESDALSLFLRYVTQTASNDCGDDLFCLGEIYVFSNRESSKQY